jgi:hypothetical protein
MKMVKVIFGMMGESVAEGSSKITTPDSVSNVLRHPQAPQHPRVRHRARLEQRQI